jgi:dienelactone hydrolase
VRIRLAWRLAAGAAWCAVSLQTRAADSTPQIVHLPSESGELGGEVYRPDGPGPFPAVLYNHGSAPGMLSSDAARIIGPMFARAGWLFFMPHRHGQGLSAGAGPYIGDELASARRQGGVAEASATLARLLSTTHLADQMAALKWLNARSDVDARRVVLAGNSFGGVEALLGGRRAPACAVVAGAAGSDSWRHSPDLQALMRHSAEEIGAPLLLFQAANDHDLQPQADLERARLARGLPVKTIVYPAFGHSAAQGHSFAYAGAATWFPDVLSFVQQHCGATSAGGQVRVESQIQSN